MKGLSREKTLQNENKHLKDLLEQVYDMSCLDEMINDGCLDRNDDEMLEYNLSLKSEIQEALNLSTEVKDVANKVRQELRKDNLRDVAKKLSHSSDKELEKYYTKPPKKPN